MKNRGQIIPEETKQMASMMRKGQMVAVPAHATGRGNSNPFLFFLIHETDAAIQKLGKKPTIEAIAGIVNVALSPQDIWCTPTLFRFSNHPELIYNLEFNLTSTDDLSIYTAISYLHEFNFLFCGDKEDQVITANLSPFALHIRENIQLAKQKTQLNWSEKDYQTATQILVNSASKFELWSTFKEHGPMLNFSR